ncbi:MAG: ABC transporter ATP-binding protein [Candidatus Coatesbacteria bacterium]|nr:ABC transporter ATP-binding protein [Candidatus Coatesbacteria bacterium]
MDKQPQEKSKSSKLEKRASLRAIFSYFWLYKRYTLWGILVLLIVDAVQLFIPLIVRSLIDRMTSGTVTLGDIPLYAALVFGIGLIMAACRFLWFILLLVTSERISERIRGRFFSHLLTLSQRFFQHSKTGDLMARVSNDTENVRLACGMGIITMVDGLLFAAAAIGMMVFINLELTLYALIPLPILTVVVIKFGRMVHSRFEAVQARISEITEKVRDSFSGIRVVKAFCQETGELEHVKKVSWEYVKDNMHLIKVWGAFIPLIGLLAGSSMAIVFLKGGSDVILGRMSVGDLTAVTSYLETLTWPMIALGWLINLLERGAASMSRINRVMNEEPEIVDAPDAMELKSSSAKIEFRHLTFSYEDGLAPSLSDISFEVAPGRTLAIVGRTGSGKSTIARLLLREFDPPPGTLFIDGKDVREVKKQDLRNLFGFVPQDSFLFSESIAENIAFGQENMERSAIEEFARKSAINKDIEDFPDGYDTIVGERGVMLSGGQKQRVAIARALVKNPPILLLDDCLSAVDTETESQILGNLSESIRGITTIIVSHRLSAVQLADEIIVLDEGRVMQRGTHSELLREGGIYAALFAKQQIEERLDRNA